MFPQVFFLLILFGFTLNAEIFAVVLEVAVRMVCCEAEEHAKTPSLRQRIIWHLYVWPSRIACTPGYHLFRCGRHTHFLLMALVYIV